MRFHVPELFVPKILSLFNGLEAKFVLVSSFRVLVRDPYLARIVAKEIPAATTGIYLAVRFFTFVFHSMLI